MQRCGAAAQRRLGGQGGWGDAAPLANRRSGRRGAQGRSLPAAAGQGRWCQIRSWLPAPQAAAVQGRLCLIRSWLPTLQRLRGRPASR